VIFQRQKLYRVISTSIGFALALTVAYMMAQTILRFQSNILVVALYTSPLFILLFYLRPMLLVLLWPFFLFIQVLPRWWNPFEYQEYNILPIDLAYFFTICHLILSGMLRPKEVARTLKENPFLTLFLFVVGVYVVLYTPVYGKSAVGEARKLYFIFLFPLLTVLSIQKLRDLQRLMLSVFVVSGLISVLAVVGLVVEKASYRTINANSSLILLFTVFPLFAT